MLTYIHGNFMSRLRGVKGGGIMGVSSTPELVAMGVIPTPEQITCYHISSISFIKVHVLLSQGGEVIKIYPFFKSFLPLSKILTTLLPTLQDDFMPLIYFVSMLSQRRP